MTNFKGKIVDYKEDVPFTLEGTESTLRKLSDLVEGEHRHSGDQAEKVLAYGINLTGALTTRQATAFRISSAKTSRSRKYLRKSWVRLFP